MMNRRASDQMFRGVFLLFLAILAFSLAAFGETTYFVSPDGHDENPGTKAQPWKTIQKAAETLKGGDTVYVRSGVYRERVVPRNSGDHGKYITFSAAVGEEPVIDGDGMPLPTPQCGLFEMVGKHFIKVSGFHVQNAGPGVCNAGILVRNCSNITIENNHTYRTVSSGIGVWGGEKITIDRNEIELACKDGAQECLTVAGVSQFEVRNNTVHAGGPGSKGGEGIGLREGVANGKVYGNRVHHVNRTGIYIDAWDKPTRQIEVFRNMVHDIARGDGIGIASEQGGKLEGVRVYNNVVFRCRNAGLSISPNGNSPRHPMKRIYVVNNSFSKNGERDEGGGIAVTNPFIEEVMVCNNICSQNRTFQIMVGRDIPRGNLIVSNNLIDGFHRSKDEMPGSEPVFGDPLFSNPEDGDLRLRPGSPAIGQGLRFEAPFNDFDGRPRTSRNVNPDIGAFQF